MNADIINEDNIEEKSININIQKDNEVKFNKMSVLIKSLENKVEKTEILLNKLSQKIENKNDYENEINIDSNKTNNTNKESKNDFISPLNNNNNNNISNDNNMNKNNNIKGFDELILKINNIIDDIKKDNELNLENMNKKLEVPNIIGTINCKFSDIGNFISVSI